MLSTILRQASWSMLGSIYGFTIGFFVKIYLINSVGTENYGKYIIATGLMTTISSLVSMAIPQVLLRFLPAYIEKGEFDKATNLASFSIQFLMGAGVLISFLLFLFHDHIATIFHDHDQILSFIIMISVLYIPLNLYNGIISASYRSLIKIKELILYGVFILVTIRAISIFIVYFYATSIYYFVFIELITLFLVLVILTKKFDTSKFSFFKLFPYRAILKEKEVIRFAKKMYFYTLIGIAGGYSINFIMSLYIPASDIGIYAILGTLSGLTAFLLNNLNTVFAPVISKYHAAREMKKLSALFKDSTFVINISSAPFIVLLIIFSREILALYGESVSNYTTFLAILIIGSYYSLFVGNSGMLLLMGGWENDEIKIKIANMLFVIILSLLFIPLYGLLAAVWIATASNIFSNSLHVFFIRKRFGFMPWEASSFIVFTITILMIVWFGFFDHPIHFSLSYILIAGVMVPLIYWLPFHKKIVSIIQIVKENR